MWAPRGSCCRDVPGEGVTRTRVGGGKRTDSGPNPAPPLKWVGGKRWLLPALRELWQGHDECRLVEPFVGGMAVALGLRPREALLDVLNEQLRLLR